MKEGVIFLQKEIWHFLCQKGNARIRGLICDLMSHSEVYTDISKETILDDEDLLQAYNDNGNRFSFNFNETKGKYIDDTSIVPLCSIYLINNDNLFCVGKACLHGIFVFNADLLSKDPKFFEKKEVYIKQDRCYNLGWHDQFFSTILKKHKCNSLILFDKYICKVGNISAMNPNLNILFSLILPETLSDIPFQISIISEFDISNGNKIYKEIQECIKKNRPKLNVQITLYQNKSDIHDRVLITNTYMLKSGAGFAIFKENGKPSNDTNLEYYPYKREEYYRRIEAACRISQKAFANENFRNYWGAKENRLFDLVSN